VTAVDILSPALRERLQRRASRLAWATVTWNVAEAVVAIGAGAAAGSIALVGFGLDSTVEVLSALVIIWQFRAADEQREQRALRLIAVSFFALAAYVTVQAVIDLVRSDRPHHSPVGIGLAVASLIVMPILSTAKKRNGRRLGSATVIADANQTKLCSYLSAVLLVGLLVNRVFGWWWADPIAGLLIAGLAVREGREAWRGEVCDDCC
jgi:divalent metal cation (Fe/Co/Zn/Cd) transporter